LPTLTGGAKSHLANTKSHTPFLNCSPENAIFCNLLISNSRISRHPASAFAECRDYGTVINNRARQKAGNQAQIPGLADPVGYAT